MGVLDLEGLADQVIDEVDHGAVHVLNRHLVHHHFGPVLLDHEIVVLPGHGGQTTIGREKATNPYLQDLEI